MPVKNALERGYTLNDITPEFRQVMGGPPVVARDKPEPVVQHHQKYEDNYIPGTDGFTREYTDTMWHLLDVEWIVYATTYGLVALIMGGG